MFYSNNQIAEHILKEAGLPGMAKQAKTASLYKLEAFVQIAKLKAINNKELLEFIEYWWE